MNSMDSGSFLFDGAAFALAVSVEELLDIRHLVLLDIIGYYSWWCRARIDAEP